MVYINRDIFRCIFAFSYIETIFECLALCSESYLVAISYKPRKGYRYIYTKDLPANLRTSLYKESTMITPVKLSNKRDDSSAKIHAFITVPKVTFENYCPGFPQGHPEYHRGKKYYADTNFPIRIVTPEFTCTVFHMDIPKKFDMICFGSYSYKYDLKRKIIVTPSKTGRTTTTCKNNGKYYEYELSRIYELQNYYPNNGTVKLIVGNQMFDHTGHLYDLTFGKTF